MTALLISTFFFKAGLATGVLFIALLLFDTMAFHRMKTPEWLEITGGVFVLLTLLLQTIAALFFIFS